MHECCPRRHRESAMDLGLLIAVGALAVATAGTGWQIWRDIRKDQVEQEQAAIDDAVRRALLERRLRELEGREPDDH